ncbi:hypothetical protein [uncultured Kordia sp.]|uniref:hypothetical protein n=1 Tax=uncultured Kordia sp. TaxID=507699 RepID=UPI0026184764|nr:hypothetical protein [uncultured Kordia sp.]
MNFNTLVGGAEGNTSIIDNSCQTCLNINTCATCASVCGDLCTSDDARCPKPEPPIRNGASYPSEEGSI